MTPEKFISIWSQNDLTERGGAQAHFEDLCRLLGIEPPRNSKDFCYEKDLEKSLGGKGWADVWKRDFFGWENKKPGRSLIDALVQLRNYAPSLGHPPLLVVCDRERIEIHTAFRGYPDEPITILLADIGQPHNLQILKWVLTDPDKLKPKKSNHAITAAAASVFAELASVMRGRGNDAQQVAHFLIQCLFCMFAEDEGLLHEGSAEDPAIFTRILKSVGGDPLRAADKIGQLFAAMQKKKGQYGDDYIAWFNGGLFKTIDIPALTATDIAVLHKAADQTDWRAIDPTIFGTLFERGLDPKARAPLGAHYTDAATIDKLIKPLISEPLLAEWAIAKGRIIESLANAARLKDAKTRKAHRAEADATYQTYLERLRRFRVLDPACGSGNFLYLALRALKDIEQQAQNEAEMIGLHRQLSIETGPHNILGIEINEFAAELARVTVWIGDIQWCRENGREIARNPILKSLDSIEHRDALLTFSPLPPAGEGPGERVVSEAEWPSADVIAGNPPFLGDKVMRSELGADYVEILRKTYDGRVPGGADLVTYWFEKARAQIEADKLQGAGLVATQSIRAGANRKVLDRIVSTTRIFEAWGDEEWVNEGAAVRVSLVGFGPLFPVDRNSRLNGLEVGSIHADLTALEGINLTTAASLSENRGIAFQGPVKVGAFDIPGAQARQWLTLPNPNGRSNAEVLRPWANGQDLAKRPSDTWIIDFGADMPETDAVLFEMPITHVIEHVKPMRQAGNRESRKRYWWRHGETVPAYRKATAALSRYIATPRVAKHRYFVWLPTAVLPDSRLYAICRDDDASFGILSSRMHEVWSLANASMHGVGNDPTYNAKSCFETFPFPPGLTPSDTAPVDFLPPLQGEGRGGDGAVTGNKSKTHPPPSLPLEGGGVKTAIATAARHLNELREAWLNPPQWVDWVITPEEEKAGFPKRPVAKPGHEADLKKRTLTNLYNARPAWLTLAHQALDQAVAAAYGWPDYSPDTSDEEILRKLLALNLERASAANLPPSAMDVAKN